MSLACSGCPLQTPTLAGLSRKVASRLNTNLHQPQISVRCDHFTEKSTTRLFLTLVIPLISRKSEWPLCFANRKEANMSSSPTKNSIPNLAPAQPPPSLLNPPSPRTHRALRRLQSAHTLGQSNQPSLISQQHKQVLQRNHSPATSTSVPHHSRGRSNSDATNMTAPTSGSAGRRPVISKKPIAADALSLDRLIREGPPDGDLIGALDSVRLKILDQGIKSDTDGMVGPAVLSLIGR